MGNRDECPESLVYDGRLSPCLSDTIIVSLSCAYVLLEAVYELIAFRRYKGHSLESADVTTSLLHGEEPSEEGSNTARVETFYDRLSRDSRVIWIRHALQAQLCASLVFLLFCIVDSGLVSSSVGEMGPVYFSFFEIVYCIPWAVQCLLMRFGRSKRLESLVAFSSSSQRVGWHASIQGYFFLNALLELMRLYGLVAMLVQPSELDPSIPVSVLIGTGATRCALILGLSGLSLAIRSKYKHRGYDMIDGELDGQDQSASSPTTAAARPTGSAAAAFATAHPTTAPGTATTIDAKKSTWTGFFVKMSKLSPFMWPKDNMYLQGLIAACLVLLAAGRVVNLFVPLTYKAIVDALVVEGYFAWREMLFFVLLKFLQGGVGAIDTLRSLLWIPVEQYTTRSVSLHMFEHLHGLSLRWHLNRKTGEVLRVMDRGTQAIASLLTYIWFNILPVLVDITVAVLYFIFAFDIYFGLIVFVTMLLYLLSTVAITEWRTKYRRTMIELDNSTNARAVDSLLNFETVKYYGNEEFEVNHYRECILKYQKADWMSQASLRLLNTAQNVMITLGLLTGGLLCVRKVMLGEFGVGDFVLFISYLQQLYQPLNWFGTYYRMIQQNFIDMEKMLDLFKEPPEVLDRPGATNLILRGGQVVFDNVSFSYDNKVPALQNVSFTVPAGKTVAFVGPSGSGKSTILRLLFRFYDIQSGRVTVDNQNIRYLKQKSLRDAIGVVPQDTVLFNDTIAYNIKYGKVTASDAEIQAAAKSAQIHEKILSFPDGYETRVGERGLRLSGGEKQRVAIARTMLKDPAIILLDEATSALDTSTERNIQHALNRVTTGRTTLVIAHRLSTVVNADLIVVVSQGCVVEQGSHDELMRRGAKLAAQDGFVVDGKGPGLYYDLWNQQLKEEVADVVGGLADKVLIDDSVVDDPKASDTLRRRSHH